jgi:2-amino-4-hydroxy-6-hydroxymethyldihydropteridine diphosphokinase
MTDEILIHVALGSNLGDRVGHLRAAVAALGRIFRPVACSAVYETAPQYVTDQPSFLNAVACYGTTLPPLAVLDILQKLEQQQGRVRLRQHGPRTLDLDLLAYGNTVLDSPRLILPHPGVQERAFVLVPWAEVAPDWRHPLTGVSVREMLLALEPVEGKEGRAGDMVSAPAETTAVQALFYGSASTRSSPAALVRLS